MAETQDPREALERANELDIDALVDADALHLKLGGKPYSISDISVKEWLRWQKRGTEISDVDFLSAVLGASKEALEAVGVRKLRAAVKAVLAHFFSDPAAVKTMPGMMFVDAVYSIGLKASALSSHATPGTVSTKS